jgi:hypothetical protein
MQYGSSKAKGTDILFFYGVLLIDDQSADVSKRSAAEQHSSWPFFDNI